MSDVLPTVKSPLPRSGAHYRVNPGGRAALAIRSLLSDGISGGGLGAGFHQAFMAPLRGLDADELSDPLTQVPWSAAATNLLVTMASSVRLVVWDRDPDDPAAREIVDPSDPIRRLFSHVADDLNPVLAMKHNAANMQLTGESMFVLYGEDGAPVRSIGDGVDAIIETPTSYRPIRGDLVRAQREGNRATGRIVGWWLVDSSGRRKLWPAGAVVPLFELPHPTRPGRGLGRVAQAWGAADQSFLAAKYNSTWLRNYGDPGGVLSYDGWLDDGQYERLQLERSETFDNPDMVGSTRIVEGGAKYEASRAKPRDMAFETLIESNRLDQSAVYGFPPALMGQQAANYATFKGFMRIAVDMRVAPFVNAIANGLNSSFLPRLRDQRLAGYRVSFDLKMLQRAIGDDQERGQALESLLGSGVPRNAAITMLDMDLDPIAYGDEALVKRGVIPIGALVVQEGAKALKLLRDAGAEDDEALKVAQEIGLRGLTKLRERQEPPQMLEGGASPKPGIPKKGAEEDEDAQEDCDENEGDEKPKGKAKPGRSNTRAAPAGEVRAARSESDVATWNRRNRRLIGNRRKLHKAASRVFNRARAQQLDAIRKFAEDGVFPNRQGSHGLAPLPTMSRADLIAFAHHWAGDEADARRIAREEPERLQSRWIGCDGEEHVSSVLWTPRQRTFLERHPRYADLGLERLRTLALAMRANVTEEEIDRLIVVGSERFRNDLAQSMSTLSLDAFAVSANAAASELGIGIVSATEPAVLDFFAARAIRVAEGTTSALAQTLRRNILEALTESPLDGTLQERVLGALKEVNAGTTRAFVSHRHRAQAIAHTEVAGADNEALFRSAEQAFKSGSLTGIGWLTSGRGPEPLGTVRKSHFSIEADGAVRVPGQTFPNGLRFPLDPQANNASEVVNCQCTIRFIFSDDDE